MPDENDLTEYCHDQVLSASNNIVNFEFSTHQVIHDKDVCASKASIMSNLEWERQVQTFLALEKKEPGIWSITDPFRVHKKIATGRSILVRLYDAIPVPVYGIELLDIVEFKIRHNSELLNLRTEL